MAQGGAASPANHFGHESARDKPQAFEREQAVDNGLVHPTRAYAY